jgi:predicted AlkP superfamily phosphohydrolase/phosphomutase
MAKKPDKVIIVGLDAPIIPRLHKFCRDGYLPVINRLFLVQGVWARNCLVPLPTVTPPNWAAIATGAWPSTVEITDFNVHVPGDELNETHQGFFSDDVHAETIYEAIAKAGKKSILLNYPSTWPPKIEDSIVLGGASLHINSWSRRVPFAGLGAAMVGWAEQATLIGYSGPGLYSTQKYDQGTVIKFQEASGWKNFHGTGHAVAAEMPLKFTASLSRMEPVTWHILVQDGKAMVCESKDTATTMATLVEGQWSPTITKEFRTEQGVKGAIFRMKLLELSPDVQEFRLYITNIAATDGWTHPASVAGEIKSEEGLPGPGMPWGGYERGWFGLDTVVEIEHMENAFFGDAAAHLLKTKPWNLFMMHAHATDHMYHAISNALDDRDSTARKSFEETELAVYKSLDEMCGKIFGCADDETIMAMVSDHGAKPTTSRFGINRILQRAGFLSRDENRVVDWSKTQAIGEGAVHIWINVKGRDPHGIVEPGEEYRKVQEEIINCLYDYIDPETGKKPIVLALRKEDARFIGLHGDWVGDVIYGISGDFGAQHAPQVPTVEYGIGDLRGLFALSGPNIKRGIELERTVWIQDLVPTICYLTGWPVPEQAEGAVIYQAMEDPNLR